MKSKAPPRHRVRVPVPVNRGTIATPEDHYRAEKARRASDPHPDSELLAAAKKEYLKMIADGAAKGKGGRPKKKPSQPAADTDLEDILEVEPE
jgi:hypothetical protein